MLVCLSRKWTRHKWWAKCYPHFNNGCRWPLSALGPSGPGQVGSQAISLPTIITDKLFTPPTIFDTRGHVIICSCKESIKPNIKYSVGLSIPIKDKNSVCVTGAWKLDYIRIRDDDVVASVTKIMNMRYYPKPIPIVPRHVNPNATKRLHNAGKHSITTRPPRH